MAATLSAFFAQNAEQIPNKKVVISNRFKDEDGNPIRFYLSASIRYAGEVVRQKEGKTGK